MARATLCIAAFAAGGLPALFADAGDGNRPPTVTIHFAGNQTFLWPGVPLAYQVIVSDPEDGDTLAGTIDPSQVAVAFEYVAEAFDRFRPPPVDPRQLVGPRAGKRLIARRDCVLCHTVAGERPIPSYSTIAEVNDGDADAVARLAAKIITGGKGVWGDAVMPPHPDLTREDAVAMARYVLSLATPAGRLDWLPLRGTIEGDRSHVTEPFGVHFPGRYVIWARYVDRSAARSGPKASHAVTRLRSPILFAAERDGGNDVRDIGAPGNAAFAVPTSRRGVLRFDRIDLTDVRRVVFVTRAANPHAAGTIEIRVGSAIGRIVARAKLDPNRSAAPGRRVPADVAPTRGVQSLFVVIRQGGSGSSPVGLRSIEFRN